MKRISAWVYLWYLAVKFGTPKPVLLWNKKAVRGQTHWLVRPVVEVGPNMKFGLINTLLHEFAHILSQHDFPGCLDHGTAFHCALLEIVGPRDYPWEKEYRMESGI